MNIEMIIKNTTRFPDISQFLRCLHLDGSTILRITRLDIASDLFNQTIQMPLSQSPPIALLLRVRDCDDAFNIDNIMKMPKVTISTPSNLEK